MNNHSQRFFKNPLQWSIKIIIIPFWILNYWQYIFEVRKKLKILRFFSNNSFCCDQFLIVDYQKRRLGLQISIHKDISFNYQQIQVEILYLILCFKILVTCDKVIFAVFNEKESLLLIRFYLILERLYSEI